MRNLFATFLAVSMLVTSFPGTTRTFELPMQLREARALFDAHRYRDAEIIFESIYKAQRPPDNKTPGQSILDSHIEVLDFYARSISQQGKTDNVLSLLETRHALVSQMYHRHSFAFASSLARVAEANYRAGNRSRALDYIEHTIKLYNALTPAPKQAIELAQSNRLQYKVAEFSSAMLPMDLSEFYSRCAAIDSGTAASKATELMLEFVEIGIDLIPTGSWADYFAALQYAIIDDAGTVQRKRVFIPGEHESLRSELCFVVEKSGKVISAESILD